MIKTFNKNDEGAVIILFAVLLMPLIMLTGMAIDITRANYVNTSLAYACDAAALAAGKYDTASVQTNGLKFFNANFLQNKGDISVTPTISIDSNNTYIICTAIGTMGSSFSGLGNILGLSTSANTIVQRVTAPSEIAVVLNSKGTTSGSAAPGMSGVLNQFVNNLSTNKSGANKLALSIVPFSATINIGTNNASWLTTPANATDTALFPKTDPWEGCVRTPYTGLTMGKDDPPSVTKWPIYHSDTTYNLFGVGLKGDNDYTQTAAKVTIKTNISGVNVGPNRSCGTPILPLQSAGTNLTNYINGIKATKGGGSLGDLGLLWGWNTLSPRWSGVWNSNGNTGLDPQPYGTTIKSIVLFSDGTNSWDDLAGFAPTTGDPNSYNADINRSTTGKLGATSPGFTGTCTNVNAETCINARIADLCTKIKANEIQIFTVDYGTSNAATTATYTNCATKPAWAFFPGDKKALEDAFTTITDTLLSIQVVK